MEITRKDIQERIEDFELGSKEEILLEIAIQLKRIADILPNK